MHFISIVGLGLFAVGQVASLVPSPNTGYSLLPRQNDGCDVDGGFEPRSLIKRAKCAQPVQCGPTGSQTGYTPQFVNAAVNAAKPYISKGTKNGGTYPAVYGANDIPIMNALPAECKNIKLWEYPIGEGGLYNGGDPGADRVLIGDNGVGRTYCLTMTHNGATGNAFVVCPATTS